ncbi:MAG: hypothetical protein WD278_18725 [Pirellulales bacterium]
MRGAVWLLLFVSACGWLACEVPIASQAGQQFENPWRRTPHGWQKVSYWQPPPPYRPALHPAVVATLEILLSLIALVAFAPQAGPAASPTQPAPRTTDRRDGVFFDRLHRGVRTMKRRRGEKRRKRLGEALTASNEL